MSNRMGDERKYIAAISAIHFHELGRTVLKIGSQNIGYLLSDIPNVHIFRKTEKRKNGH